MDGYAETRFPQETGFLDCRRDILCGRVTLKWQPAADPSGIRNYEVELEKLTDRTYVVDKTRNNLRADSVSFQTECGAPYRLQPGRLVRVPGLRGPGQLT
jgi:hypothetical protein